MTEAGAVVEVLDNQPLQRIEALIRSFDNEEYVRVHFTGDVLVDGILDDLL